MGALVDCLKRARGGETFTGAKAGDDSSGGPPCAFVPIRVRERKAIVLLLLYIANAGRVYRELICDEEGVSDLLVALQREEDAEVAALLTELFITLGNGVPRLGLHVQCGLLRLILAERDAEERLAAAQELGKDAISPLNHSESSDHTHGGGWNPADVRQALALASESFRESVLQAVRALRGLQLSYETRYFSGFEAKCRILAEIDDHGQTEGGEWNYVPVICLGGNSTSYPGCPSSFLPPPQQQPKPQPVGDAASLAVSSSPRNRQNAGEDAIQISDGDENSLLRAISLTELLNGLFFLANHECSSRYRVEGSELLTLVAKNINLTEPILNYCFDVLNDCYLSITDDEADFSLIRQQRRQLCSGRTAVQVILSKPMTSRRHALIMRLIAIRSAHLSLLRYLRMTDQSDTAAVLDCCMALQIVARASNAAQHARMLTPSWLSDPREDANNQDHLHGDFTNPRSPDAEAADASVGSPFPRKKGMGVHGNALLQVGHAIREALGDSLYQAVLYQKLSDEECFAMQRACRDAALVIK
ncbi:unnamed protein product [Phytomonas sp. Hart1]|nr:unnamed protein product [Phytomonas sp. Hart1]|eukprot:CCW70873.1 unnamed protein product [Phytomonas sp. isolate Hart1]